MPLVVSDAWRAAYPGAGAGALVVRDATNLPSHPELTRAKRALEASLRERLGGADRATIQSLPEIAAYNAYYKRFHQTYHVQLQLESIALKGRDIPDVATLVEAMFVAEVRNLLLTAGHDLATVAPPVELSVATGEESFTRLNGKPTAATRGDMLMRDGQGVISTVLHGPDDRTAITAATCDALFVVYAPAGIAPAAIRAHLEEIAANVRLVSPEARIESLDVYQA